MSRIWREEDISMGFRCPEWAITTSIPQCNVCMNWDGPRRCKKLGASIEAVANGDQHNCPYIVYDTEDFSYPRYAELYPEEVAGAQEQKRGE